MSDDDDLPPTAGIPEVRDELVEHRLRVQVLLGLINNKRSLVVAGSPSTSARWSATSPTHYSAVRDRALLLLGFAGAMRRSELVGLNVTDLAVADEGLVVNIRRGKTDQVAAGRKIGIPRGEHTEACPVRAVQTWLEQSGVIDGAVFRAVNKHGHVSDTRLSDRAVADIVKRTLKAAGKSPRRFAGHSLRAGLITQAAMAGVSERAIQDQSGHKSLLVMRRYIRDGSLFRTGRCFGRTPLPRSVFSKRPFSGLGQTEELLRE